MIAVGTDDFSVKIFKETVSYNVQIYLNSHTDTDNISSPTDRAMFVLHSY